MGSSGLWKMNALLQRKGVGSPVIEVSRALWVTLYLVLSAQQPCLVECLAERVNRSECVY